MTETEVVRLENTPEMAARLRQLCKEHVTDDAVDSNEFVKNMRITNSDETIVQNVDNDYERELIFYQQALKSTIEARRKFSEIDYPYRRPADYYAEMLKSDAHMDRVRPELIKIQKKIEAVEQRKKNLEMRKEENKMKKQQRKDEAIQRLKAKKEKRKARFRDKALAKRGQFKLSDDSKVTGKKQVFGKKGGNNRKGGKPNKGGKKGGKK